MMNNYINAQQPYFAYSAPRPQARYTQPLTQAEISKLRENPDAFSMKVTQEEIWRAICTHKDKDGTSTLVPSKEGKWRCNICGAEFGVVELTETQIKEMVDTLIEAMQVCKTVYLDVPEELAKQYYQMLPLLERFPKLFAKAMQNFEMYEGNLGGINPIGPGMGSAFNTLNTLMPNPYGGGFGGAMYQQPQAGYYNGYQPQAQMQPQMPQQMPMYQQPQAAYYGGYQQPMMAQNIPPQANPLGYGSPSEAATMPQAEVPAPPVGAMPDPNGFAQVTTSTPLVNEVQQQQTFNV